MRNRLDTRRARLGVTVFVVVGLALMLFTGYQALRAKTAFAQVSNGLDSMGVALRQGDVTAAKARLADVRDAADSARGNTRGPGWWLGSRLPLIGDDIGAVRTVADVAHNLTDDVIPEMLRSSDALLPQNLRPQDGRVRLAGVKQAAPGLEAADKRLQVEVRRVTDIRSSQLSAALSGPIANLQKKLGRASEISTAVSQASQLLPSMMADGSSRRYLLMFQSLAEVRSTGGIGGSFALIDVKDGKATMGEQGNAASFIGIAREPVVTLTKEEKALFGDELAIYPQDVNFTPDFPRSGEILSALYQRTHPDQVDGVLSADPVALSYLLAGTGPVKMPRGLVLTAQNVVPTLLSDSYLRFPSQEDQTDFFDEAAKAVFDAVANGQGSPGVVLDGMVRATLERRVMIWSSHADEQKALDSTRITGTLADTRSRTPNIDVYFNDGTGAKMSYYLDAFTEVEAVDCLNGEQQFNVRLVMRSVAPRNASQLPSSVLGLGPPGLEKGSIRTSAYVYGPVGGAIDSFSLAGKDAPASRKTQQGRPVRVITIDLAPGETKELTITMRGARGQDRDVQVRMTPGVRYTGIGRVEPSKCAS